MYIRIKLDSAENRASGCQMTFFAKNFKILFWSVIYLQGQCHGVTTKSSPQTR